MSESLSNEATWRPNVPDYEDIIKCFMLGETFATYTGQWCGIGMRYTESKYYKKVTVLSKYELSPQIYKGDTKTCAIFIPAWDSNRGLWIFPVIEVSVVCQVRMSPASNGGLSIKINTCKMLHGTQRSWKQLFCACFCMSGQQKSEDPQFEPHGWPHYMGWYTRSGISLVYLWYISNEVRSRPNVPYYE